MFDLNVPSVIFDCDGVILHSNRLKSDAFGAVLSKYDNARVDEFVEWHRATGGVSRFTKFQHFFRDMIAVPDWEQRTEAACAAFGDTVFRGLIACDMVPGVDQFLKDLQTAGVDCTVNTGGAQAEVRTVFQKRDLAPYFKAILGSPATKHDNMGALKSMGYLEAGSVYFGDSQLDWELARDFDLDFVFIAFESEWQEGAATTAASGGRILTDFTDILSSG